jgi:uncharacterized protein YndB with AHSA1/START domain
MNKNNRELTLTRIFDAPRELVFKAWTVPKLLAEWWGPKGVTNTIYEFDARPLGNIHIVMIAGEELGNFKGIKWPMRGIFHEVIEAEKLVFTSIAIVDDKPILENLNTVVLEEHEGKTKMVILIAVTKTTPEAEGPLSGMEMGWNQSLDKLADLMLQNKK